MDNILFLEDVVPFHSEDIALNLCGKRVRVTDFGTRCAMSSARLSAERSKSTCTSVRSRKVLILDALTSSIVVTARTVTFHEADDYGHVHEIPNTFDLL